MLNMKDKTYDVLKYIAQLILPAIATLCLTLAGIWNIPFGEQIAGTITAVNTFLGVILGIANSTYKKRIGKEVSNDG